MQGANALNVPRNCRMAYIQKQNENARTISTWKQSRVFSLVEGASNLMKGRSEILTNTDHKLEDKSAYSLQSKQYVENPSFGPMEA